MQISLKWVNELVTIEKVNLDYLIEKLTLGGFEVEEIIEVMIDNQKTTTLDISATANRSDSLCIQGISLEIAALLNKPTNVSNYGTSNCNWKKKIDDLLIVKSDTNQIDCSVLIALTIGNLNNLTTPKWLQQKLAASGINPQNNLLDFQNYILLETGYPFEFYDLKKICSKLKTEKFDLTISSNTDDPFFASDKQIYKLDNSILILKANNFSIGIGGILPANEVSYSNATTALLIEGSIFNSTKIRQQSRKLGLRTDRSTRYEKSLKSTNLLEASYRLISLLRIANPNLYCKLHTLSQSVEQELLKLSLHYNTINKILGPIKKDKQGEYTYISPRLISKFLKRLTFTYTYDENNLIWEVTIPDFRSDDIVRDIDLIEEIGRLYGFNNFLTQLPPIRIIGLEDASYQTRKKLTFCLLNLGFNELIHYSLVNSTTYVNNEIKLVNPLLKDCSNLRSSLLPNLIKTVEENLKKSNLIIEGFEYGHVFANQDVSVFTEKENLAGIFGGIQTKSAWSDSGKPLSWFEAKGKIEQLFKKLNILVYWKMYFPKKNKTIFHSYRTGELYLANGKNLGIFGQINPLLAKKLNISTDLYLFELDFKLIQNEIQANKLAIYQEYSFYPKIVKDLSFIIDTNISFNRLQKLLYANGSKFLTEIILLDEYKGKSIPKNSISLCIQLVFQSTEKTLQTKEVENILMKLESLLIDKFTAIIRA